MAAQLSVRLRWRRTLYAALEPQPNARRPSSLNRALGLAIVSSVAIAVLETEAVVAARFSGGMGATEALFGLLFTAEYLARIWVAPEKSPDRSPWAARAHWLVSPTAIVDLLALLPFLIFATGTPFVVLRLLRLLRILRMANLGPMSSALDVLAVTISARRIELGVTALLGGVVLIISSTLLHVVEGPLQPEAFGSVLRALWWTIASLTPSTSGGAYPVTTLGKAIASITAVVSIWFVAAPTGILAAGFSDALQTKKVAHAGRPPDESPNA